MTTIEQVIKDWKSGVIDASTAMGMIATLEAEVRRGPVAWRWKIAVPLPGSGYAWSFAGHESTGPATAEPLFASPQPADWRPIETAPKDGTRYCFIFLTVIW